MDRSRVLSVVVVLVCVFAMGTAATTLESTLTTDPDDVVDLDWRQLPLSEDQAADVKDEIESNKRADSGDTGQAPDAGEGQEPSGGGPSGDEATGLGAGLEERLGGLGPTEPDFLDKLLALLRALLPLLLAVLALLAAAGLASRYRDRLKGLLLGLVGLAQGYLSTAGGTERSSSAEWAAFDPEHEIDQAWLRMVRELESEAVPYRTPAEYARAAKLAGMPSAPVETVTRTFEEVRYGGRPVTAERRQQAHRGLKELGLGGGAI